MTDEEVSAAATQFLKNVSAPAQREIEKALRNSLASRKLQGYESLTAAVTFFSEKAGLDVTIYSKIEL
jgi:Family of unknown function (DUF6494)